MTLTRLGGRVYRVAGRSARDLVTGAGSAGRFVARAARVFAMRISGTSDYRRWSNPQNLETWWDERTQLLARMVPAGSSVIEFGAGRRQLETYIDPSCRYVPSDLVDRGPGTLVCDLNARPLPHLQDLGVNVAVFSGVFEYVADVPAVIDWLASSVSHVVASYAYVGQPTDSRTRSSEYLERLKNGYLSHFSEDELVALFRDRGFVCAQADSWQSQRLFHFTREPQGRAAQGNGGPRG